ncbi:MAG: pilus assembly protein PilM [Candidatus Omnitrophica bacterium]|nr:pilus assembly protein PilM [Candidatus Omnitrophota bacterium]
MKLKSLTRVVTTVSFQGRWVKLLQVQSTGEGPVRLLGMKARQVSDLEEKALADALKELVRALPVPPGEVMGLISTAELLTRYLILPSQNPQELQAMAGYQLEGLLPYSLQECVTSVKVLGPAGEGTRVLVAAAHRPVVERMVRICQQAGLNLTRIAASSEAIGHWHRACWPTDINASPKVWLVAELTREGLDLGVLVGGSLVYMREVPHRVGSVEELTAQLQETIQAYTREQVGPPVEQVTLSGWLEELGSVPLERQETALGLPVRRVDPLEASPFREALSITAQELSPEVSFSELLGAVCAPRFLELELLPLETRQHQLQQLLFREFRRTGLLVSIGVVLVSGWSGAKVGATYWQLRQVQGQVDLLNPQVARVKAMAAAIRSVQAARQEYVRQLEWLDRSAKHLSPGMTLQFLGLEAGPILTLRGAAPDLAAVTAYAAVLREESLWGSVLLRSAKTQRTGEPSNVEFEMVLQ